MYIYIYIHIYTYIIPGRPVCRSAIPQIACRSLVRLRASTRAKTCSAECGG